MIAATPFHGTPQPQPGRSPNLLEAGLGGVVTKGDHEHLTMPKRLGHVNAAKRMQLQSKVSLLGSRDRIRAASTRSSSQKPPGKPWVGCLEFHKGLEAREAGLGLLSA